MQLNPVHLQQKTGCPSHIWVRIPGGITVANLFRLALAIQEGMGLLFFTVGGDTVISKYLCKARYTLKDPTMNDPETNDDVSFPVYRDGTAYLDVAECWNSMGRSSEALYPVNGFMATDTQLGGYTFPCAGWECILRPGFR